MSFGFLQISPNFLSKFNPNFFKVRVSLWISKFYYSIWISTTLPQLFVQIYPNLFSQGKVVNIQTYMGHLDFYNFTPIFLNKFSLNSLTQGKDVDIQMSTCHLDFHNSTLTFIRTLNVWHFKEIMFWRNWLFLKIYLEI